jgi:hypothetical protein
MDSTDSGYSNGAFDALSLLEWMSWERVADYAQMAELGGALWEAGLRLTPRFYDDWTPVEDQKALRAVGYALLMGVIARSRLGPYDVRAQRILVTLLEETPELRFIIHWKEPAPNRR